MSWKYLMKVWRLLWLQNGIAKRMWCSVALCTWLEIIITLILFLTKNSCFFHFDPQTALCNTVIDNPNHSTKSSLIDELLNYVDSDAILYFSDVSSNLQLYSDLKPISQFKSRLLWCYRANKIGPYEEMISMFKVHLIFLRGLRKFNYSPPLPPH